VEAEVKLTRKQAKAMGLEAPGRKRPKAEAAINRVASAIFEAGCASHGLPAPVAEYRFCEGRKWAFDYCWPDWDLALEIEGGVWTGGRHVSGGGFLGDVEKYNAAALNGWFLLRCTPADVESGEVFALLKRFMG
jgi:hypothetical protein